MLTCCTLVLSEKKSDYDHHKSHLTIKLNMAMSLRDYESVNFWTLSFCFFKPQDSIQVKQLSYRPGGERSKSLSLESACVGCH